MITIKPASKNYKTQTFESLKIGQSFVWGAETSASPEIALEGYNIGIKTSDTRWYSFQDNQSYECSSSKVFPLNILNIEFQGILE